jgi:hypothetical protein
MKIILPVLVLSIIASHTVLAAQNYVTKYAGWTYISADEPRNPQSLTELPEPIQEIVIAHLNTRLGKSFYSQLLFVGGQIVDIDAVNAADPERRRQWEIHKYDLHFKFEMPDIGIESYTAQIKLREDGSVITEIDLPAFAKSPEKNNIISISDAIGTAISHGYSQKQLSVEVDYDRESDSLIWVIEELVADDGLVLEYMNITINAHTGDVINQSTSEAIR